MTKSILCGQYIPSGNGVFEILEGCKMYRSYFSQDIPNFKYFKDCDWVRIWYDKSNIRSFIEVGYGTKVVMYSFTNCDPLQ